MLRVLVFLIGLGLVATGVTLWSLPAGLVTAGIGVCTIAVLMESAAVRREGPQ